MIDYIITAIVCFAIGWKVREWYALRRLASLMSEMESIENGPVEQLAIKIEKHKDMFYVYDDETDMFLAQGATKDDIAKILQKTHPKVTFVADPNNIREVDFK